MPPPVSTSILAGLLLIVTGARKRAPSGIRLTEVII